MSQFCLLPSLHVLLGEEPPGHLGQSLAIEQVSQGSFSSQHVVILVHTKMEHPMQDLNQHTTSARGVVPESRRTRSGSFGGGQCRCPGQPRPQEHGPRPVGSREDGQSWRGSERRE